MHTTIRITTVAFLLLAVTSGCDYFRGRDDSAGTKTNGGGNVAIIDLDAIAKQLGYDTQIVAALRQTQQQKASLVQQLGVIKASYERELGKRKNDIGDKPTEEQTKYLLDSQRQANVSLNQEKAKVEKILSQYSQHNAQLIRGFRDRVKTAARGVASEKGLSVILTKNDSVVLDYSTAVDITDAVVERMRAEPPIPPAPLAQPDLPRPESTATKPATAERR